MASEKITFLVPCLNERKTILEVLDSIFATVKKLGIKNYEIIVSDSGSTDGSLEAIKTHKSVRLLHAPVIGYGAALDWGIKKATSNWVFFADSDCSYHFSEFQQFLPYVGEKFDLVVGNRFTKKMEKGAMPFLNKYLGTPILSFLIRIIYKIPTFDCNSGMRMVRRNFYRRLKMRNAGMEWASEQIIRTSLHHGRYKEVKIQYFKDKRGRTPHLNRWLDGWRHLKAIFLLKPSILLLPACLFFLLAVANFRNILFFVFVFLAISLLLSVIAAWLLNCSLDVDSNGRGSRLFQFFLNLPLVKTAGLFTVILGFVVILEFESNPLLVIFIAGIVILYDMWVFFIETIKTHLISSLNKNG